MKRAAVFFDRDNTLIANDGYLGEPNGVELIEGAANAVARARTLGFAVVVFSNQSGVARGMFTEEAVHAVNHRLDEMLADENGHAIIDRHEFCPFHPNATVERYRQDSDLRKPKPGMILQAERQLALDLSRSWVIGDAPRDMDAGKAAGCRTILVKTGALPESPASTEAGETKPDFEVESLAEAMEVIARHKDPDAPAMPEAPKMPDLHVAPEVKDVVEPEPEPEPEPAPDREPEPETSVQSITETAPTTRLSSSKSEVGGPAEALPPEAPARAPRVETETVEDEPSDAPEIPRGKSRPEILLGQILEELRRRNEHPENDFSVTKLMAGVVQIIALAALFLSYVYYREPSHSGLAAATMWILAAIFLQTLTISLLIMGRQK